MLDGRYRATEVQAIAQVRRKHVSESLVSVLDAKQACLELPHAAALLDGVKPNSVERRGFSTEQGDGPRGRALLPQKIRYRELVQLIQSRIQGLIFVFEIVEVRRIVEQREFGPWMARQIVDLLLVQIEFLQDARIGEHLFGVRLA